MRVSMNTERPSFPAGAGPAREEQPIFKPVPPHEIHDSGRLICGYNSASEQDRLVLEYRLLYHDMADPSFGYPVNTEIEGKGRCWRVARFRTKTF